MDSLFYLRKAIDTPDQPTLSKGASGYFNAPENSLDPNLFDRDVIKPDVREYILRKVHNFWHGRYKSPVAWSQIWLAGSGVSYQWSGDRGNGDLDVLIGIDFGKFFAANPEFEGLSPNEMAAWINDEFRNELWPQTAHTIFGQQTYEVTFYVNPQSPDIRDINPYAAYNLSSGSWTVPPPVLSSDPRATYPRKFWEAVDAERAQARLLVRRYETLRTKVQSEQEGSPGWINSMAAINIIASQAKALFDDIHMGRRKAFGEGGEGYGDFYNFRWQAHKDDGTVASLSKLAAIVKTAKDAEATNLYGNKVMSAEDALTRAALWNTRYRI